MNYCAMPHSMEKAKLVETMVIWYEVSCFMYPFIVYKIVNIYVFEALNARTEKGRDIEHKNPKRM